VERVRNFTNLLMKLLASTIRKDLVGRAAATGVWNAGVPDVRRDDQVEEACAIAALTQAIVVKLHRLYTSNQAGESSESTIEGDKWARG